jgi:Rrf2 family protein
MILRNQVEWALHCCSILAGMPPDHYLATKTLAEFHGVPKEYLSKALQALSTAGLVVSTLGPTGGYRLAKPTTEITFLDIVEAVEGKTSTFACSNIRFNNPCLPSDYCDKSPCGIARIMWQADEAWRAHLRGVTLAQLEQIVADTVPADILRRNNEWLLNRP